MFARLLIVVVLMHLTFCNALLTPAPKLKAAFSNQKIKDVKIQKEGDIVDVHFEDGTAFAYHSLWLRDACRDDKHVVPGVGERELTATAAMLMDPVGMKATKCTVTPEGGLCVEWNDGQKMIADTPNSITDSTFTPSFLRSYADIVAKPIDTGASPRSIEDCEWIRPYTGYPDASAPKPENLNLWGNDQIEAGKFSFRRYKHSEAFGQNLDLMQSLMRDGVVLVDEVPECSDASELLDFVYRVLGGMQKDPARDEPNWKITKKSGATSISYAHDKRLINHTDQSIPPHGVPGLVLCMHYLVGQGANTLTDGFAAAEKLRKDDPKAFELLATYGYDAERDFQASRVDSAQEHNKSLLVSRKHPIFRLDKAGNLAQITYNEVFRTPVTLPFDVFPEWFAAFNKFVQYIHDPQFETVVPMQANTILIMHNWRVLHGRAGNRATPTRTVVGGTITREAFFSRATQLMEVRDEILGSQM